MLQVVRNSAHDLKTSLPCARGAHTAACRRTRRAGKTLDAA